MPYETLEEALRHSRIIKLEETKRQLSESGFYYSQLSNHESMELLKNSKIRTFIVRNSSSIAAPLAISYQNCQGPTSIRIYYQDGKFVTDHDYLSLKVIQGHGRQKYILKNTKNLEIAPKRFSLL